MIEKLLHTPQGMRDIYGSEWKRKDAVIKKLGRIFALYGYQDISTPAFEFFDIFNSDTGTVASTQMFKFFDRNNNTLVLRPDMTPSVARSVAKYYSDCQYPLRLCYRGNTYINHENYQGKLTEKTELGAEHINNDSPEADAEAVAMVIACFLESGLKEFCVDIGHAGFYRSLMRELNLSEADKGRIHESIENRNALAMELLLGDLELVPSLKEILLHYHELTGDSRVLDRARDLAWSREAADAIDRLRRVYEILCQYGYGSYVRFDLGMVSNYDYYTGILFQGYTYGTGDAIGKGGRYNELLARFGKDAPAIGFTILVDDLMSALWRQKIPVDISGFGYFVLLYKKEYFANALRLAVKLRAAGHRIELLCLKGDSDAEYRTFVRGMGAEGVLILKEDKVEICDFRKQTGDTADLDDLPDRMRERAVSFCNPKEERS